MPDCFRLDSQFHLDGEMVGWVGLRAGLYVEMKLRVAQLQEAGAFFRPLRIEDLGVPLLTARHIAGLDVGMLDHADLLAPFGECGDIRIPFWHTNHL